jgi:hypothetical protein
MVPIQSRILAAILYADVFHYPLTVRELTQWIPSDTQISSSLIHSHIKTLVKKKRIGYAPPFLYVSGHKKTIQFRIERLAASTTKWQKIRRTVKLLRYIPTIGMVGVTGGLAVNNADNEDDIDLLIVAKHHTLWITRFLVTVCIELVSKRRHPMDTKVSNAICLNMFLTDGVLQLPKKEQGWYTAHEVLQMVPLWQRNHMYTKYLHANRWVQKWFRGRYEFQKQIQIPSYNTSNNHIKWYQIFEQPIKRLQVWYMRNRRTTEIVSDSIIRFHPKDARIWIRKSFLTKLHTYKVPLDKKYNQI